MKKREEDFVLVPATFRERKNFWNKPRTYEEILAAEQASAERKRFAEEEKAAADEAF
jgi:hypothetical protein